MTNKKRSTVREMSDLPFWKSFYLFHRGGPWNFLREQAYETVV